jgi:hypothetical protein
MSIDEQHYSSIVSTKSWTQHVSDEPESSSTVASWGSEPFPAAMEECCFR